MHDLVYVVRLNLETGANAHEDPTSLLAEHFNILVLHRVIPDHGENAGPDHTTNPLPELGSLGPGLMVIAINGGLGVLGPFSGQVIPERTKGFDHVMNGIDLVFFLVREFAQLWPAQLVLDTGNGPFVELPRSQISEKICCLCADRERFSSVTLS